MAQHFVAALPSNLSNYSPSASTIASYLERANLNDSITGLAICILDALSNRFVRSWRQSSFYAAVRHQKAEVIVVAALAVASAFLDDWRREARWWSEGITWGVFSKKQINVTIRCVLADIDYDLHAFTPSMIADAAAEIGESTTGSASCAVDQRSTICGETDQSEGADPKRDSGYGGDAIWNNGIVTPEPSPVEQPFHFLRLL